MTCPTCGLPVIDPATFEPGRDSYFDTPGGHADRHALVVEAAERAVRPVIHPMPEEIEWLGPS